MLPFEARQTKQSVWRKASFCASGECVEVAVRDGMIVVRDSKNPRGRMLRFTTEEWQAFVRGVKAGGFDYPTGSHRAKESAVQPTESVRDKSAPENWLDLVDRILYRATSTWRKCLMHLALLAVFFGGLGMVAYAAAGVSPWIAAAGSLGGGAAAGGAAYARRRSGKPVKNGETQLAQHGLTRGTVEDH
jgi:hypothetical protein